MFECHHQQLRMALALKAWTSKFYKYDVTSKQEDGQRYAHIDHLDEVRKSYVLSKYHNTSFTKEVNWKANKPLELVHTNMCGPIKPMSTRHNKYFTLINDFSRKTWIYFLKRKLEMLNCFKDF